MRNLPGWIRNPRSDLNWLVKLFHTGKCYEERGDEPERIFHLSYSSEEKLSLDARPWLEEHSGYRPAYRWLLEKTDRIFSRSLSLNNGYNQRFEQIYFGRCELAYLVLHELKGQEDLGVRPCFFAVEAFYVKKPEARFDPDNYLAAVRRTGPGKNDLAVDIRSLVARELAESLKQTYLGG